MINWCVRSVRNYDENSRVENHDGFNQLMEFKLMTFRGTFYLRRHQIKMTNWWHFIVMNTYEFPNELFCFEPVVSAIKWNLHINSTCPFNLISLQEYIVKGIIIIIFTSAVEFPKLGENVVERTSKISLESSTHKIQFRNCVSSQLFGEKYA